MRTSDDTTGQLDRAPRQERILGELGGETAGPTVVVMCGIHGNEPTGVRAARRVLDRLAAADAPGIRGRLVVIVGNLTALQQKTRFVELDLNRQWSPDRVRRVRAGEEDGAAETAEQREILRVLDRLAPELALPAYFLDLHTSSADGPPFLTVGDTLRNRAFAMQLPLPLILGLEEQVDGALLEYLNNQGFVTLGVEAGHHDRRTSVDRHEAVLWLTLVAAGLLRREQAPVDLEHQRRLLLEASHGIPRVMEVRYRHPIAPRDSFAMEPGFANFGRIARGDLLARDASGPVRAREDGLILLPLYQGKGDDGFFVAREVQRFWLGVSASLRRLRADRWVHLLPGVRRQPGGVDVLAVDTRVARLFPLELLHLMGFRKLRWEGDELTVSRRRYDLASPSEIRLA
jgi:succinylglutamate desuccinylase